MYVKVLLARFRSYHPALKAIFYMLPITLTVFAHNWFLKQPPETSKILKTYYEKEFSHPAAIFNFVVTIPLREEFLYRGPAWALLVAMLLLGKLFNKLQKIVGYCVTWLTLILLTYSWAIEHHYPITVFGYGILWGGLMFTMRYKWYSIAYPMLFHSTSNALALLYIAFGYHFIYK